MGVRVEIVVLACHIVRGTAGGHGGFSARLLTNQLLPRTVLTGWVVVAVDNDWLLKVEGEEGEVWGGIT